MGCLGFFMLVLLPLAQAEISAHEGSFHKGQMDKHIQEIYNQLDLTDAQKAQLDANKAQHRAKMDNIRKSMKINKEELRAELMKSQLNMLKISAIHEKTKAILSQMEDEKLDSILAVRNLLTPEQFSKFASMMHQHREKEESLEHHEHGE